MMNAIFRLPVVLFMLFGAMLLSSCQKQPAAAIRPMTVQAEQSDSELLRIAEEARRTLPVFFRHLARADADRESFRVKYPFAADDGSGLAMEQVWLGGIFFKDGQYYGVLVSNPLHLSGRKKGDTVAFDADAITDWMYIEGGKIAGGRSIKYLLEKNPEDRGEGFAILRMFD